MSDAIEAPETQDTPVEESTPTPIEEHGDTAINWEERYKAAQAELTPVQQERAQLRDQLERLQSDPSYAAEILGIEFVEDESPDAEDPDELTQLKREFEQFKSTHAQESQQAELARINAHVEASLSKIEAARGTALSEKQRRALVGLAVSQFPPGEDRLPQVNAAWDEYQAILDEEKKLWIGSKQAPAPPSGMPASDMPDLDNEQERIKHMVSRLQAKRDV